MSFRHKQDDWTSFCRKHREDFDYCGIPQEVWKDRQRFMGFLDHGFDEIAWIEKPHIFYNSASMSDDQFQRLAAVCAEIVDGPTLRMVRSRWGRYVLPEDNESA